MGGGGGVYHFGIKTKSMRPIIAGNNDNNDNNDIVQLSIFFDKVNLHLSKYSVDCNGIFGTQQRESDTMMKWNAHFSPTLWHMQSFSKIGLVQCRLISYVQGNLYGFHKYLSFAPFVDQYLPFHR